MALVPQVFLGGKYGFASIQHGGKPDDNLKHHLEKYGIFVVSQIVSATHYLSLDVNEEELKVVLKSGIPKRNRILIVQEPEIVLPANFAQKNLKCFQQIIFVGRVPITKNSTILWPQFWPSQSPVKDVTRISTGAVMVASNHLSFIKGELYSLRRICAYKMQTVQVFGRGWNHQGKSRIRISMINLRDLLSSHKGISIHSLRYWFKKYKSPVESPLKKLDTIMRFKTCLVIENSQEFLSEKLFDSFFAQCIPVYVGPDVKEFGIPEGLVIQCKPNVSSVAEGISRAESMDYETWLIDLNKWLHSEDTIKRWSFESYVHQISKILLRNST